MTQSYGLWLVLAPIMRLTDDAMPCGVVLLIEFFLDEGSDILLNVELLESLGSNIDGVLLHV